MTNSPQSCSAGSDHAKVADWLDDQARIATNSLHCGDNSAIIQQTHDWASKMEAAARHLRGVAQAVVVPAAWRWKPRRSRHWITCDKLPEFTEDADVITEPLYAAQPLAAPVETTEVADLRCLVATYANEAAQAKAELESHQRLSAGNASAARVRSALQAAKDVLRGYAKIEYDQNNNPQPNHAFDVEQMCKEALYEIDLASAKAADLVTDWEDVEQLTNIRDVPQPLNVSMAEFVKWAMQEGPWSGNELDGGDVQDKACKLGLLVKTQYDPDIHGESEFDIEPGDDWFVLAPEITSALTRPHGGGK